eukprot:CAMPEP_0168360290 /NCGR_PEP_ID=MMETSP0228-20121227/2086_1 /TAXON_ID=133427 /ORGANISM="Protoceratium reticulatum, Strain CCCM 535 (=CCMP 1889)" /LENGTH=66 /DNA_ID=CAMNT_0008372955 /DNA_START=335 /DNA_END=531 /DNA_ORIENTATION=-
MPSSQPWITWRGSEPTSKESGLPCAPQGCSPSAGRSCLSQAPASPPQHPWAPNPDLPYPSVASRRT